MVAAVIDSLCADAVCLLNFPMWRNMSVQLGKRFGPQASLCSRPGLMDEVLHRLKREGPQQVLAHLAWLGLRSGTPEVRKKWSSLRARHDQMQYSQYQAAVWPIRPGLVERANKVVEARLRGTGMSWERVNVHPLLLLRNAVCHDQWKEDWLVVRNQHQRHRQRKRQERRDR